MKPFLFRHHKFIGPEAELKAYVLGLFRRGVSMSVLALAMPLTEVEQIIAESNGGKLPSLYYSSNSDGTLQFYRRAD